MQPSMQTLQIDGFDPESEPEVEVYEDGRLVIRFGFMPPSWTHEHGDWRGDLGPLVDFDKQLSVALDVPVHWEDREVFVIPSRRVDTLERLTTFLRSHPVARRK